MKIGFANIHNIDCMEFMKRCDDNQFDLAIVDPPYGIGAGKNGFSTIGNTCCKKTSV